MNIPDENLICTGFMEGKFSVQVVEESPKTTFKGEILNFLIHEVFTAKIKPCHIILHYFA